MIEKAKYPKYITRLLNTNFKQPICIVNMLKICFRNYWKVFNQIKSPDNFVLYLLPLVLEEVVKIVLIEKNPSLGLLFIHFGKDRKSCSKVQLKEK